MPIADDSLAFQPNLNGHLDVALTLQTEIRDRTRAELDRRRRLRDRITTPEALRAEQRRVREAVRAAIGGLPAAPAVPRSQTLRTWRHDGLQISTMIFHRTPRISVPATLYRPEEPAPAAGRGAVLITCGHTDAAKADPEYQRLARRLAASGLVVLIFDPIGQGERHSYLADAPAAGAESGAEIATVVPPGTAEHTYAGVQAWWHQLSPARYFLADALAGLELLRSLPDVDPTRVGVTGNSGGGYLCCLLMAVDEGLAAAAPGTFVCGRGAYLDAGQRQDAEQILLGGTVNGLDHGDLLTSMSPAPVLVLAAEYDFFPYPGTLAVLEESNALLRRCGRDPIGLATTPNGHRYDDRLAVAATDFFVEQLGGRTRSGDPDRPYPAADLQVSRTGQVLRDDPEQQMIFDQLPRPEPGSDDVPAWLAAVVRGPRQLLDTSGRRWFDAVDLGAALRARQGFWWTERGIVVTGILVTGVDSTGPAAGPHPDADQPLRIVLLDRGTPGLTGSRARKLAAGATTLFLDVRGTGATLPHDREHREPEDLAGSSYKLLSDLLWLGDSLQAGRAWDVLQTIALIGRGLLPDPDAGTVAAGDRIEVIAEPSHAFTGALAALLDERIGLVLTEPLDLDRLITDRLWDDGSGRWQWVLPGWPEQVGRRSVADLLRDRLVVRR